VTGPRFSGASAGACIGHVGAEALAGGPIGKLREGDLVRIGIERNQLVGSVHFVGETRARVEIQPQISTEEGAAILAARSVRDDLRSDPDLPAETRLWAALQ